MAILCQGGRSTGGHRDFAGQGNQRHAGHRVRRLLSGVRVGVAVVCVLLGPQPVVLLNRRRRGVGGAVALRVLEVALPGLRRARRSQAPTIRCRCGTGGSTASTTPWRLCPPSSLRSGRSNTPDRSPLRTLPPLRRFSYPSLVNQNGMFPRREVTRPGGRGRRARQSCRGGAVLARGARRASGRLRGDGEARITFGRSLGKFAPI
jgi:hypothetical protein